VKSIPDPNFTGYDCRIISPVMVCTTCASSKKLAVSDQFLIDAVIVRARREKPSCSNLGESARPRDAGEPRSLRIRCLRPRPAKVPAMVAFHLPSGEHGLLCSQGTFPMFTTSKVFTALPTLTVVLDVSA